MAVFKRKKPFQPKGTPMEYALRSLTRRRQTIQQLHQKLQKYFPDQDHQATLDRLKELGYLDDAEFCRAWIRHRSLTAPRGSYKLNQELKLKGVAEDLIQSVLQEYCENDHITDLAQKKWKSIKGESLYKRKEKLTRFLVSRGFGFSNVINVVNAVASESQK